MTHEQSNKISSIIDALEDEYIRLSDLLIYEYFRDAEKERLKFALSSLNSTIEMLYAAKNE